MLKLCYKPYEIKMSLGAMKKFKQDTGKDLWHVLISFMEAHALSMEKTLLERMKILLGVCDFETASYAFHCLLEDKSIPLDEIQDGMFRVGWMPTEQDGDLQEPWPLLMVATAWEVNKQFQDVQGNVKKKADTSEQPKEKQK